MISLRKGNKKILKFKLMVDHQLLDNLSSATKIVFAAKDKREDSNDDAPIYLEWLTGQINSAIAIDTPEEGWVTVTLSSSTTDIPEGVYYFALQIEWFPDDKQEFIYGDGQMKVEPDVIR